MKRFAACLLSLSLLLTPALAAGTDPRREDLDFLCASLQDIHPGFDALVDKAAFTAKKAEIEARTADKLARGEFAYEARAAQTHLSRERALEWLARNAGPSSEYVFLHQHKEKDHVYQLPAQ